MNARCQLYNGALSSVAATLLVACRGAAPGSVLAVPGTPNSASGPSHVNALRPAYNICRGGPSNGMLPRMTVLSSGTAGPTRGLTPADIQSAYNRPLAAERQRATHRGGRGVR